MEEMLVIYICEADRYFSLTGEYKFDASKLGDAHKWCRDVCEMQMKGEFPIVIVSNTFTTEKEMEPYYNLAKKHDYQVFSLIVENRHNGINQHSVPQETLDKMKQRFQISL